MSTNVKCQEKQGKRNFRRKTVILPFISGSRLLENVSFFYRISFNSVRYALSVLILCIKFSISILLCTECCVLFLHMFELVYTTFCTYSVSVLY